MGSRGKAPGRGAPRNPGDRSTSQTGRANPAKPDSVPSIEAVQPLIRIYIAAYRYTYDEITEVYGDQLNQTENGFSVIDEAALRSAIGAMGYEVKRVSKEPHEKRGLFHR